MQPANPKLRLDHIDNERYDQGLTDDYILIVCSITTFSMLLVAWLNGEAQSVNHGRL